MDTSGRASTLLLALLIANGQRVVYVPGRRVNRMPGAYRGEGKTDAKDARGIADQARMRRDFAPLDTPPELVSTLQLLTRHRADLIGDRVRLINRLRDLLVGICPALERVLDYSAAKGPVRAAKPVCDLAHQLLVLDERIKDNDREIRATFRTDERAEIIESMPGMGRFLGAEFVATVGDLSGYRDAGRLASHAGLAPVARDSGRRTGNYHRPKRYNRCLRHIFSMAAPTARMRPGPSRDYYLRKGSEGLLHTQALLTLARRRVDVLWAMPHDQRMFTSAPPVTPAA